MRPFFGTLLFAFGFGGLLFSFQNCGNELVVTESGSNHPAGDLTPIDPPPNEEVLTISTLEAIVESPTSVRLFGRINRKGAEALYFEVSKSEDFSDSNQVPILNTGVAGDGTAEARTDQLVAPSTYFVRFGARYKGATYLGNSISFSISSPDSTLPGRNFYISPNGSDANPGTLALPWKTIAHAVSSAIAGDNIYIRAGTYSEALKPVHSGKPGSYVTFSAYPGEKPVLDASKVTNATGIVEIRSISYLRIVGLTLKNNLGRYNHGVFIYSSHHIRIERSQIEKTGNSGIKIQSCMNRSEYILGDEDIIIDGNELIDNNITIYESSHQGLDENISIVKSNNWVVRNNLLRMTSQTACKSPTGVDQPCGKEGIDAKVGSSYGRIYNNRVMPRGWSGPGIYVDAWDGNSKDIKIYGNRVEHRGGIAVSGERCGDVDNVQIYNNLVIKAHIGIRVTNWPLKGQCAPLGMKTNITVINNTVIGANVGIQVDDTPRNNIVVRNNIAQTIGSGASYRQGISIDGGTTGVTVERNLVHGLLPNSTEPDCRNAFICKDPKFVSQTDLHLTAGSPAINQGSMSMAPLFDFENVSRPQGPAVDIGAYEFKGVFQ